VAAQSSTGFADPAASNPDLAKKVSTIPVTSSSHGGDQPSIRASSLDHGQGPVLPDELDDAVVACISGCELGPGDVLGCGVIVTRCLDIGALVDVAEVDRHGSVAPWSRCPNREVLDLVGTLGIDA